MRARQARRHALIFVGCLLSTTQSFADDTPPATKSSVSKKTAEEIKLPPLPKADGSAAVAPSSASNPITPATMAEASREKMATEARLNDETKNSDKDKATPKPVVEILNARLKLLDEWKKWYELRIKAEKPEKTPESEAAEFKADLEKSRALLDQSSKSPDALLPEVFLAVEKDVEKEKEGEAKRPDSRLGEMKEAMDSARNELKDQSTQLEKLRTEGSQVLTAQITAFRGERDKVFQGLAGLTAQRGERQAALTTVASGEGRDLAREKLVNLEWQARIEVEKLAEFEAKISLNNRRIELATVQVQAKAARVQLAKRAAERMEARYAALAEKQRNDLKKALAKEESRAASSHDPLERRRAQRNAQLLDLESQVVAYEKTFATTSGVSFQEQDSLKDKAVTEYAELRKLLDDGTVSPLDALRLKNDFRRIGPERAQIVKSDLARAEAELTTYENALTDAEIDLVNDSRDDRFDLESLLEELPPNRRGEAEAMLEGIETRHKGLLNRRRNVLRNLASRAEETHECVLKRIATIDDQYAFIRTHIFWIRDAEPVGASTFAHARDDAVRTAKALMILAMEVGRRNLWSRPSAEFLIGLFALGVVPLPLLLGQRALDRLRLANTPSATSASADSAH